MCAQIKSRSVEETLAVAFRNCLQGKRLDKSKAVESLALGAAKYMEKISNRVILQVQEIMEFQITFIVDSVEKLFEGYLNVCCEDIGGVFTWLKKADFFSMCQQAQRHCAWFMRAFDAAKLNLKGIDMRTLSNAASTDDEVSRCGHGKL